jgi:hypothetical protein
METAAEEYRDQIENWKETVCAIHSDDSPPDEPEDEPEDER